MDLSAYLDNTDTQLTEAQVDAYVANNGYLTGYIDTNTDEQTLTLSGNTLAISNGNTVNLTNISPLWASIVGIPSDILDGDDNTQLTEAQVDAYVSNNGYLTGYTDTTLTESEVDAFVANNGYLT